MRFKQEINVPMVVTTGAISVMVLIVLILGTQAWFQSAEQTESQAKAADASPSEFVDLKQQQWQSIQDLAWRESNHATVRIPIDQAMKIIVETGGKLPSTQPSTGK